MKNFHSVRKFRAAEPRFIEQKQLELLNGKVEFLRKRAQGFADLFLS